MRKIMNWYRNTRLSARVILSMNLAILLSISIISVLATINRQRVQINDANALVNSEMSQLINLLEFAGERDLKELSTIIEGKVFYNNGFVSIVSANGEVVVCKNREGQNLSNHISFQQIQNRLRGQSVYRDPVTGSTHYQYFLFYAPKDIYLITTLDKREFVDKYVWNTLRILGFALIFTWIAFSLANYFIMKTVTKPINRLVEIIQKMAKGDLTDTFEYNYRDEVGQMSKSVKDMQEGLQKTAIFAGEIGKNNFDHEFEPLGERDILGNALLDMRKSLKTAKEEEEVRLAEDKKRNWTTQGLARFGDILRTNRDNINDLTYDIIKNLVEYLDVNQGGIFVYHEDEENNTDKYLELTACFAFDRRKFVDKKVLPGEGLVGTCFLEKESIYLTKIPQDYIKITSGLGDENPSALLLVPLKVNEEIFGILELASFHKFEKYQIEFVEKIAESIASTIASVKINTKTAALLLKSQQQAEEMRAQEEEMRQNMEELTATQETMAEKDADNQRKIAELSQEYEACTQKISEKEQEKEKHIINCPEPTLNYKESGEVQIFNAAAEQLWGFTAQEVTGNNVSHLIHKPLFTESLKGVKTQIVLKSGIEMDVIIISLKTGLKNETSFTAFIKPLLGKNHDEENAPPQKPVQTVKSSAPTTQTEKSKAPSKPVKKENDKGESESISELHKGDETDNQKAWSDHMGQMGKQFKKGKKK